MKYAMEIKTIQWKDDSVRIIDQTLLPAKIKYLYLRDIVSVWRAIKKLQVRGAPALGAAGALGVYLGVRNYPAKNFRDFEHRLKKTIKYISSSRPTARNLFWGLERVKGAALTNKKEDVGRIKELILREAEAIIEEDMAACRRIGNFGQRLISDGDRIMTICNAGALATVDYGTALGVIYSAVQNGKSLKVFACETRPLLQGARLTSWELKRKGIDTTLICDNMAATLMAQGKIDKVITGADRIAKNGDTANKIGTYNLAVLADYHRIPFFVAAPSSTFDLKIGSGKEITIEERAAEEVTTLFFKKPVAPNGIKVFNPAFDTTPCSLIRSFITDKGIIGPPFRKNISGILSKP